MTDWDPATVDTDPIERGAGFLAIISAIVWLICLPFDLCASLRRSAHGDDGSEHSGALEGAWVSHNGDVSK